MTEKVFRVIDGFDCENKPCKIIENTITNEEYNTENTLEANSLCEELNRFNKRINDLYWLNEDLIKDNERLKKENKNLKKALWKSETAYIEETNEFSIDVEKSMEWLKKEFEKRYWND